MLEEGHQQSGCGSTLGGAPVVVVELVKEVGFVLLSCHNHTAKLLRHLSWTVTEELREQSQCRPEAPGFEVQNPSGDLYFARFGGGECVRVRVPVVSADLGESCPNIRRSW